jgi:hypothetical protein
LVGAKYFDPHVPEWNILPQSIITPDVAEIGFGKLTFNDGAPTPETAKTVSDFLIFTNGLNVYNNSFRGASAYALQKGFRSIGANDNNTIIIFSELMDAKSLFLTANADTVYYLAVFDLTKGPMVIEQPPKSVGTINDMWFSWIIDIGFPGPDRGEGGKYLIVPPGSDGPLPDSGFHVARSKTNRVLNWRFAKMHPDWFYYENSMWGNMLWEGGYNFETPPPMITKEGYFKPFPPTGARTLDSRTAFYYAYTLDSPGMIMRVPRVGSQYLMGFLDADMNPFDGGKTYKCTLPKDIPAEAFWSFTVYDNQSRSMLDTPQRYPRAGSQRYPTPAAVASADGSTTIYFGPEQPQGVERGNWIQTMPGKGWFTILRLYSPLESFFTKEWRAGEIELVK